MPYIQGIDFISDTTECRRQARNVVTADFTDDQIESYQYKHYSTIRTLTDKDDWDSADREFGALQEVEITLTVASIIKHYGDVETIPIWQAMISDAMMKLADPQTGIINNMDTEPAAEEVEADIERTDFKGWGLNPSIPAPNRRTSTSAFNTELG